MAKNFSINDVSLAVEIAVAENNVYALAQLYIALSPTERSIVKKHDEKLGTKNYQFMAIANKSVNYDEHQISIALNSAERVIFAFRSLNHLQIFFETLFIPEVLDDFCSLVDLREELFLSKIRVKPEDCQEDIKLGHANMLYRLNKILIKKLIENNRYEEALSRCDKVWKALSKVNRDSMQDEKMYYADLLLFCIDRTKAHYPYDSYLMGMLQNIISSHFIKGFPIIFRRRRWLKRIRD